MIQEFHNAINTKLNANSTIAIYPIFFAEVPQSENLNTTDGYIRWTSTFGDARPIHGDDIELSDLTISIFSKSLITVNLLHKEVMIALDDTSLSISGYDHIHTQRSTGHLPPERELDTRLWHQVLLYEVMYL